MANVNGYKLSKLEQIEDPETSGKNLNDEALFLVSDTEDGSTYVSKSLKYADLVTSVAATMEERGLGGNGGGSGGCLLNGLDLPGRDYPVQNLFFANQPLTANVAKFTTPQSGAGIYFSDDAQMTVPVNGENRAVNVYCVLSANAQLTGNVSPGAGIYIQQQDQNGNTIKVPIKDDQRDAAGWIVCVANFTATPGTVFGGYIYNPKQSSGILCAFFQEPKNSSYNGEDEGANFKLAFSSSNLFSTTNTTLTEKSGFFNVKSSLALTSAGNATLYGSQDLGKTWFGISTWGISTNAGSGSGQSKLRQHPRIYFPSGCYLKIDTNQSVSMKKYVTNKDIATVYLYPSETTTALPFELSNGIAAKFTGPGATDTMAFKLAGKGRLNAAWRKETYGYSLAEQYNYTTVTNHDGQYLTTSTSPHIYHRYSNDENGEHEACFTGETSDRRILAFNLSTKRNKMTSLSCYSPTTLSASCLCGMTSLKNIWSNSGKIASLEKNCLAGCTALTAVELTCASQLKINDNCLCGDTALKNIKIKSSQYVSNVFGNSFAKGCTALTSVTLPKFNNAIGDQTTSQAPFYGCTSLQTLTLSATNAGYLGGAVAHNCTSLTSFTLSGGCKCINSGSIFDATTRNTLKNLTMNFSVAGMLSASIISGSTSLTSVSLDNVKIATTGAFKQNSALRNVTLAGNVTSIANQAFLSCPAIEKVDLQNMTTTVSKNLFGSKCFAGSSQNIAIHFPKEATTDQITAALTQNTKTNSILFVDVKKGENATRIASIFKGNEPAGTFTFTHSKNNSGTSSYTQTYDV